MTWLVFRVWGAILWTFRQQVEEWGFCPWCNDDSIDWFKEPWFKTTNGGTYYIPGEPTVHWAEGWQTCPRCYYRWFLQASD